MKVVYLCGRICSGKSSYRPEVKRIKVSNVVRSIINTNDRKKLQNTMHLDQQIIDGLIIHISQHIKMGVKELIIDGIRQPSILKSLLEVFPGKVVWLQVPIKERKRRYEHRKAEKDTESFDKADNKPIELECQEIYGIFKYNLQILNNY